MLSRIPFAGVITALWGSVFDRAFANRDPVVIEPSTTSLAAILREQRFFLLKVYGNLDDADRVPFISKSSSDRSCLGIPITGVLCRLWFQTERCCSWALAQRRFRDFLAAIDRIDSQSRPERTHYALVPSNKRESVLEQERMRGLYNVALLPYDQAVVRSRTTAAVPSIMLTRSIALYSDCLTAFVRG